MKSKGIFFDLDGTMWDATDRIRESWNIAIKEFDGLKDREITAEELQSVMGMPMDAIVEKLFPELSKDKQLEVLDRCCEVENKYLEEHGFENVGGEFTYIPNDLKEVDDEQRATIDKMVEKLEEFDDVQNVYTNMK